METMMPKFTLVASHVDEQDNEEARVTLEFQAEQLEDVVGYMQDFLRGVGYYFDGELVVLDKKWR